MHYHFFQFSRFAIAGVVVLGLTVSITGCGNADKAKLTDKKPVIEEPKDPNAPSDSGLGRPKVNPTEEDKANAETAYKIGVEASKNKNWEKAIEELSKAVSYDPLHVAARTSLGWAYSETGQWNKAILHLHEAIKLDPNNAAAHGNLAWAYAESEKYHLAVQEAKKATDLDSNNAYAFGTMGWGYSALGEMDLAKDAYEKALAINPNLSSAHAALGSIYCQRGETASAKAHLNKLSAGSAEAEKLIVEIKAGCG